MTRLALLTACDRNYLPGAAAMLGSARRHHPGIERFCMVPPADVAEFERAIGHLTTVLTPPRRIAGVAERLQLAHAKVFAADLTDFDVVAWVDTDVLFCRPAPEIWQVAPGRATAVRTPPANRVPHNLPVSLRSRFAELYPDLAGVPGFNGGLLAVRPTDWPDLQPRLEAVIRDMGCENHPEYFDQPLLNAVFRGRADLLPEAFNWTEMFDAPPDRVRVRVVHFASKPKPWMPGYPRHEPGYWFWVRHGLAETSPARLAAVNGRIWLHTPKRLLARAVRRATAGGR